MMEDGEGSYLNALLLMSKGDLGGAVDLFADFLSRCPDPGLDRACGMVNARIAEHLQTDFDLWSVDHANYGRLQVVATLRGASLSMCGDLLDRCRALLPQADDAVRVFHAAMGLVKLSQMSLAACVLPREFIPILEAMERYYSEAEYRLADLGEDLDLPGDAIRAMRSFSDVFGSVLRERCSGLGEEDLARIRGRAYTPPKPPFFDALVEIFVHMDSGIGNCETGYDGFRRERDRLIGEFMSAYLGA